MAMRVLPRRDILDYSAPNVEGSETEAPKRPIAFFIPGLEGGGAQRVFVTLVNTLVTMAPHPIHLVTAREGGVFETLVDRRVVRITLGHKHVSHSVFSLAQYIRIERPVAMISTMHYCNVAFLLATLLAGVPLRKVVREAIVVREQFSSFSEHAKAILLRALMRLVYRRADAVIIITKDVKTSLLRHRIASPERMCRIPNPVVLEGTTDVTSKAPSLADANFILAIGRLSYGKGFDILIRAFAKIGDPQLKLVILGDGPRRKDLELLAKELKVSERVSFPGFVQNTSVYLRAASVFVLSSRWEGFSNVLAEALVLGTPIVASDCPGSSREVLEGGRLGRLVPVDDPRALAHAIARELASPSATREARRERAQEYKPERIAARYLRVLMEP